MPEPQIKERRLPPVPAKTHTGRVCVYWGAVVVAFGSLTSAPQLLGGSSQYDLSLLLVLIPLWFLQGSVFGGLIMRAMFSWVIKGHLKRHPTKPTGWFGIWRHDSCPPLFQWMFALDADGSMKR
jgi:hypothetical protein